MLSLGCSGLVWELSGQMGHKGSVSDSQYPTFGRLCFKREKSKLERIQVVSIIKYLPFRPKQVRFRWEERGWVCAGALGCDCEHAGSEPFEVPGLRPHPWVLAQMRLHQGPTSH